MRTQQEMMRLLLDTAQKEERIRAAILNGSRANPNAPKDIFQDYDVVYIVKDIDYFMPESGFIDGFGKRLMLQMPETMRDPVGDGRFTYLILFEDGNRIDLQLIPIEKTDEIIEKDSESILLLDKDGMFTPFPPASDADYHIKRPTQNEYDSCCNNFWWCLQNVAKGICRDELPYAMEMYETIVRQELNSMVEWHIGIKTEFSTSAGKMGKYFKNYLNARQYESYRKTYSDANYQNLWTAMFTMCDLFRETATGVAQYLGFIYPKNDDVNMTAYLKRAKTDCVPRQYQHS